MAGAFSSAEIFNLHLQKLRNYQENPLIAAKNPFCNNIPLFKKTIRDIKGLQVFCKFC